MDFLSGTHLISIYTGFMLIPRDAIVLSEIAKNRLNVTISTMEIITKFLMQYCASSLIEVLKDNVQYMRNCTGRKNRVSIAPGIIVNTGSNNNIAHRGQEGIARLLSVAKREDLANAS